MTKQEIKIYGDLLKTIFRCDDEGLLKVFNVLNETCRVYGGQAYFEAVKGFINPIIECLDAKFAGISLCDFQPEDAYYYAFCSIVHHLVKLKEVNVPVYDAILDLNYEDPETRFKEKNFETLADYDISREQIIQLTQKLNEFLTLLNSVPQETRP